MTLDIQIWEGPIGSVRVFRDDQSALGHIRDHLLTGPECHAWALLMEWLQNTEGLYEDIVGGLDPHQRQQFSRTIFADPDKASEIYDHYVQMIKKALSDSEYWHWKAMNSQQNEHIAFSPMGVLVIWRNQIKQKSVIITAFLPGLGVPFDLDQPSNTDPMLRREATVPIKPMRDGRRGYASKNFRTQKIAHREHPKDLLKQIYYTIFKIAFRAVRQRALRDSFSVRSQPSANLALDRALVQSMPKRGMISFNEWKEYIL